MEKTKSKKWKFVQGSIFFALAWIKNSMSEFFVQKSKTEFVEYAIGLGELISDHFPECEVTKECIKTLKSMDGDAINEALNCWMSHLSTPLTKKVKYAKAVERIIKSPTTVMHALKYHDMDGIESHINSEVATKLDVFSKFKDDKITEDVKKVVWKFLEKIATSAYEAKETAIPTIPSRQDIQENIRNRKKETVDEGPPSMQRAFMTHINALCKTWGQSSVLEDDDVKIKSWMTRWSVFAQKEANGVKNSTRLAEKDPTVIDDMRKDFPELRIPTDFVMEDGVWVNFSQLTSFSTVG